MAKRPRSQAEIDLEAAQRRLRDAETVLSNSRKHETDLQRQAESARKKKAGILERRDRDFDKHRDADKFEYQRYGKDAERVQDDIDALSERLGDIDHTDAQNAVHAAQGEISQLQKAVETSGHQELLQREFERSEREARRVELAEEASRLRADEAKFKRDETARKERNALVTAQQAAQHDLETVKYQAQARAAEAQFDWQQRIEEQGRSHDHARDLQGNEHRHQEHLTRLSAEIAERAAQLDLDRYSERMQIDVQSHVLKAREDGKIARRNVSHETDERIREARALLGMAKQKRGFEAQMEAKILLLKHYLEKDMIRFKAQYARETASDEVKEITDIIAALDNLRHNN